MNLKAKSGGTQVTGTDWNELLGELRSLYALKTTQGEQIEALKTELIELSERVAELETKFSGPPKSKRQERKSND